MEAVSKIQMVRLWLMSRKCWRGGVTENYEKLSNEEFPWNKESLTMADATSGPCEKFTVTEVHAAIKKMKDNKAAGPSGVTSDMIKAAGEQAQFGLRICVIRL